jgi:MFS family permease
MPPVPPIELVLEKLHELVIPAAGSAALVMGLFLLLGRWAAAIGSAVAIVVAFLAANFSVAGVDSGDPLSWDNTARLIPWKPSTNPDVAAPPGWHWLPRVAVILVGIGLVTRWAGLLANRVLTAKGWWAAHLLVWIPRILVVDLLSSWLTTGRAAAEWPELRRDLVVSLVLLWLVLDSLARAGRGAEVAAYLALVLMASGMLLLYAHSARFMELAVLIGSAMLGLAVIASVGKADTSGAIPAAVVFLPGLLLGGRPSLAENQVPSASFWLITLAPATLAPFLIPALGRRTGWLVILVRLVLILTPVVVALVLAAQYEQLAFEEEW